MLYKLFVEIGRVVLISEGRDTGKIAVIVNVIDQNRVLIDGGSLTGVERKAWHIKQLRLLYFVVEGIEWRSDSDAVKKAIKEQNIVENWQSNKFYQRFENTKTSKAMGDFNRYKLIDAKSKRNKILNGMVDTKVKALEEAVKM